MDRGEIIGLLQDASRPEDGDEHSVDGNLKLRLLGTIMINSQQNKEYAAVTVKARSNSPIELSDSFGQIIRLSSFAQQEGFQTDEAQHEQDGYTYHQLTVFWGAGKDTFEQQLRLGKFDLEHLISAA